MRVKPPSLDALSEIAESYGFDLSEEDLESFQGLISPIMASYERLDQLPEPALPVKYARTPGHRPSPEDNPSTPGTGAARSKARIPAHWKAKP